LLRLRIRRLLRLCIRGLLRLCIRGLLRRIALRWLGRIRRRLRRDELLRRGDGSLVLLCGRDRRRLLPLGGREPLGELVDQAERTRDRLERLGHSGHGGRLPLQHTECAPYRFQCHGRVLRQTGATTGLYLV